MLQLQKEFNKHLDNLLSEFNIKENVFAVGVSGGADSLALALLLKFWNKAKIVALTVDHGLRKESSDEAKYVGEIMKIFGIEHFVLEWKGKKPTSGIEEAARDARYNLMERWCVENGVKNLMTAHHKFDQAETFLMRMQRGSGVDGLAAMLPVFERDNVKIIRPLLEFEPLLFKEFLKTKQIKWVNDPHNELEDFLRVRIRKIIPELDKKIGLSADKLAATAKRMARVRDYLHLQTDKFVKNNVRGFDGKAFAFSVESFDELHEEIALRVLAKLLKKTGEKKYTPRLESLEKLYQAMKNRDFLTKTLSGCEVIKSQNKFWIVPEFKKKQVIPVSEWEEFLEKNPAYKKMKLPHKLRLCLIR